MTMTYGQTRADEAGRSVQVGRGQRVENIDFALPAGGVIVLRIGNRFGEPAVGYSVLLYQGKGGPGARALIQFPTAYRDITDDRGEIRMSGLQPGEYYVSAEGVEPRTFYPGTGAEADAQPITVGLGEEVVYGFNTVTSRKFRISGRITGASPQLRVERRTPTGFMLHDLLLGVAADGTFSRAGLSPGEYLFTARNEKETGTLTVQLGEEDVSGLVLTMRPVSPIRGRITFEGTPPPGVAQAAFALGPQLQSGAITLGVQYKPDWVFEIPAVSGAGVLRFSSLPRGWFLKSVLLDGKDVTDTLLDLSTYQGRAVEVVVTQTATEISGSVTDAGGRDVTNFVAVAFADDSQRWTPLTRAIASVRADQQGRFSIRGLPPGRYLVAAVDFIQSGQERDPKMLERLRAGATTVVLAEGAAQDVTLKVLK